ncbi:hypothetical protein DRJ22_03500 [Candidatus Woesearchaeota archaeon]|nr:MAG: hypothetical protein DRJ22_03500 [Candidatus Woesearchaeota archaeon]
MLQYIIWIISFITLWLIIVWLNFIYTKEETTKTKKQPKITFAIPAYNEEKTIIKTIKSLLKLNYPAEKKEIIIVNDGSTDKTEQTVKKFIKEKENIILINQKNNGKASAINTALKQATGQLFAVLDADSYVEKESINHILPHFENKKTGAVISRIKIDKPKKPLEKLQYFEYIMSNMLRKIMTNFGTLSMTPGVLSVYNTATLRKAGGFSKDKNNMTEDLEIALRLKDKGYNIYMEPKAITYTKAPNTLKSLWQQRIRWSRGYIYNHIKYKHMFFSKKHGIFGIFQLPINALAIILLVINMSIITYNLSNNLFQFILRSLTIHNYFITRITDWPTLKQLILARNVQISIPLTIAFILSLYLMTFAMKYFKESIKKNYLRAIAYMIIMPYFTAANWITSIYKEIKRSKRKW